MSYYRPLIILTLLGSTGQAAIAPARVNLSEVIYYASMSASANKDCRSARQAKYSADFERKYGERVARLEQVHVAKFGPDPGFISTTDCRRSMAPPNQQNRLHQNAMGEFEVTLRGLEIRFGGY